MAHTHIYVRLDRLQIISQPKRGEKPPELDGYRVVSDSFVRRQTTTTTYARCRHYRSSTNSMQIFWQYARLKSWLMPWKITLVGDDEAGLSRVEIERVVKNCSRYRFLTVEIAVDFPRSTGVNRDFVRQYGIFGKSRRRA